MKITDITPPSKIRQGRYAPQKQSVDDIMPVLEKKCSEILAFYRKYKRPFYRGNSILGAEVIYGKPHNNRNPLSDEFPHVHQAMNKYLSSRGLVPRNQATFMIASRAGARTYAPRGSVFIILPVNGFEYTWSEQYDDLVVDYEHELSVTDWRKSLPLFKQTIKKHDPAALKSDETKQVLNKMVSAIKAKQYDIMSDLIVELSQDLDWDAEMALMDLSMPISLSKFKEWGFQNSGLIEASRKSHEVWFSGPYYGILDTEDNRKRILGLDKKRPKQ